MTLNPFASALRASQLTTTENGAVTRKTSGSSVLDFFSRASAMRGKFSEVIGLFDAAAQEDLRLAVRALFHLRDIRGGSGERVLFRSVLVHIASFNPELARVIIHYVPEYGRWDDLWPLLDIAEVRDAVAKLVLDQIVQDLRTETPSLLAKWLPSENASSAETKHYARVLSAAMFMKPSGYRRIVSRLRKALRLVETAMTQKRYELIDYGRVPAQAMRIHGQKGRAFPRNDAERFGAYLEGVKKGERTIKAGTLNPVQLVGSYLAGDRFRRDSDPVVEAQWAEMVRQMPDGGNRLVIADTSGSMFRQGDPLNPIEVALAIATLIADSNTGPFHRLFLSFSEKSSVQELKGDTLLARLKSIDTSDWNGSTNIQAAFDRILKIGVAHKLSAEQMPTMLIIVSDMQFNSCGQVPNFETAKAKFAAYGYSLPHIVFWNVAARVQESPVHLHEGNVSLVSGPSQNIFKSLMTGNLSSPYSFMLSVLDGPRYNKILA